MSVLGCGTWTAQVVGRGGSPLRFEFPFSTGSATLVANNAGRVRISIPDFPSQLWSKFASWRDELNLYRDEDLSYAGPIIQRGWKGGIAELLSQDLSIWMDRRFLEEDFHGDGDAAEIYQSLWTIGYEKDISPNMEISTRNTGIRVVRDFEGKEFRNIGSSLKELARTALDYTMVGRKLLAGGVEIFLSDTPLIVHDDGCLDVEIDENGTDFATDVAVFGSTGTTGGSPVSGRATRATSEYGLLQKSYTELTIKDTPSADANALSRLEAVHPVPLRIKTSFSQQASFKFKDLIPSRRGDLRLKDALDGIEVVDTMRLQQVDVNMNDGEEQVVGSWIPLGVSESAN